MRIALVYHQFIERGGLEGYLLEFARRLRGAGHDLTLVTTRADERARALASRVEVIVPRMTSAATLAAFARESGAVARGLGADAVFGFGRTWCQDIHRAGGGCHARYSQMLPWWKRWKPKNRLELALERRLYTGGETRLFVVNAEKVRDELEEFYQLPADRVRVIRTAVDTEKWRPAADGEGDIDSPRRALGTEPGRPVFLFASLDHRRKGLPVLLEALTAAPDAELWVAGKPVEPWLPLAKKLGVAARLRGVGRADLLPYYQAADWFVHPTQYDACANTVLQSLACGLPGIISSGDGASELITDGVNGRVMRDPSSASELADHLRAALAVSPSERAGLSTAARASALPLTWEAHLRGWMDAVAKLPV